MRAVYNIFLIGFFILVFIRPAFASPAAGEVSKANRFYTKGQFDNALDHYQKALSKDPQSAAVEYNLGTALYKKGDYTQSVDHLQKSLLTDDPELQSRAQYNLGNVFYRFGITQEKKNIQAAIGLLEKSLAHYEKVLKGSPKDADAQYNDEFVKKELERLKQKQQQQKNQKQDQNKDQKQDQKDKEQKPEDKKQDQPPDQNKKDQQSPEDQQSQDKKDQSQDQSGQPQGDQQQDKKDQENKGKPQPADGDHGENPQDQEPSQATDQEKGSMTANEAKITLEDYQRNEEPKGMLYFAPQKGNDKPVGKDW